MFFELEIPLATGSIVDGESNPLFNLILDLFLLNPMPVRGLKLSDTIVTREQAFGRMEESVARYSVQCTVYTVQLTEYSLQYTVYRIQCTMYSLQYTVYSLQYTVYSTKSDPHRLGLDGEGCVLRLLCEVKSLYIYCITLIY